MLHRTPARRRRGRAAGREAGPPTSRAAPGQATTRPARAGRRRGAWAALLLLAAAPPAPLAAGEIVAPGPKDRCPVCGMFVHRYPQWIAGIRYRDGGHLVFDGPKDLMKFWLEPARHGGARPGEVQAVFVTDYYAVRQVDARAAWFVLGSDVLGPMGRELVPFASEGEARTFLADHGGRRLLRFHEITPALLRELG